MATTELDSIANVLVIHPPGEKIPFPDDAKKKYHFIYHFIKTGSFQTLQDNFEDAIKTVEEKCIEAVFVGATDDGALIRAAIVQSCPWLKGPSLESLFLCHYKYYTHYYLDPCPIPYTFLGLSSANLEEACQEAIEKVPLPSIFKPCPGRGSADISRIDSSQQLKDVALNYKNKATTIRELITPLLTTNNIKEEKYPLINADVGLIQKYMGDKKCANADGYVFNGKIFHWTISDSIYSQLKPEYYFGSVQPSAISSSITKKIWMLFDQVVGKMVEYGFNNSFANVEVFICDTEEVRLMEINPRVGANTIASDKAYDNGNVSQAELMLLEGKNPKPPKANGRYGMYGYIRTHGSGKAKELIDYSLSMEDIVIGMADPEKIIDGRQASGVRLASICLEGESREELMDKYRAISRRVLLKPELSMWE